MKRMRFRAYPLRFSIERSPNGPWVLVDWALGLVAGPGSGRHEDAEQLLAWVREYVRHHGDINLVHRPKSFHIPPRFPAGERPKERPEWRKEQRSIIRAYTRIAEIVRVHQLQDDQMSTNPTLLLAKRRADRLLSSALASVGLHADHAQIA